MKPWIPAAALTLLMLSSADKPTPKPKGYFRIALPDKSYDTLQTRCPYQFEVNEVSRWHPKENCWGDLRYPGLRATFQFTYKSVQRHKIDTLLNEAHSMAYEHTVRASAIEEDLIYDDSAEVYGLIYRLKGAAATPFQFFLTDSSQHFLRGALYYYASPNADSLRPVNRFMEEELEHMVETFKWKN